MIVDQSTSHLQFINRSGNLTCEVLQKECDIDFLQFEAAEAVIVNLDQRELRVLDREQFQKASAKEAERLIENSNWAGSKSMREIIE